MHLCVADSWLPHHRMLVYTLKKFSDIWSGSAIIKTLLSDILQQQKELLHLFHCIALDVLTFTTQSLTDGNTVEIKYIAIENPIFAETIQLLISGISDCYMQ